jgi:hypothetical protein
MAIVQISRIQHRRGLQQDLPNLASAELGWSLDERRLYIGNGTLEEGAPTEGVTEILTEYTDFIGLISSYTFKGTEAGYTSVTGASALTPVVRTLQNVLDETISVRDFGASPDASEDVNTAAIQRAIKQVYVSSLSNIKNSVRRTIRFPAGNYAINSNLVIPPNCTLVGDGKNNSIITSNVGVIQTCDSLFQISSSIGTGGATPPGNITIRDLGLTTTSNSTPVAYINKATNVLIDSVNFTGGSYNVTIDESSNVEVSSSTLRGAATGTFNISGSDDGLISRSNYFDTVRKTLTANASTSITTLANGAGKIDYEITSGTSYRIGTIKYNRSGGVCTFDDEYNEPAASIGANLWVRSNGAVICAVGSTSTLKYNIKQFI